MIGTLLRRIEQNPEAYFSGLDLADLDEAMLTSLKTLRIIEALPIDRSVSGMTTADGRVLDVVEDDDGSERSILRTRSSIRSRSRPKDCVGGE